jgi:hypothetical protein
VTKKKLEVVVVTRKLVDGTINPPP